AAMPPISWATVSMFGVTPSRASTATTGPVIWRGRARGIRTMSGLHLRRFQRAETPLEGQALVVGQHPLRHAVPAEELGSLATLRGDLAQAPGLVDGVDQRLDQRVAVLGPDEDAVRAVGDYAREAIYVARYHGAARGHCLQQHDALALVARVGRAEHVRGLVVARQVHVRDVPGEHHVAHMVLAYPALVGAERAFAVAAHQDQPCLGPHCLYPGE